MIVNGTGNKPLQEWQSVCVMNRRRDTVETYWEKWEKKRREVGTVKEEHRER